MLGDESTCRRALDRAAAILLDGPGDPDMPYLSLDAHHLARWRGNCLVRFDDPETVEIPRSALAGMDGTYNRAEAALRCDLGHALLVLGDPQAAQPHIHRAQQLAVMTGSRRQQNASPNSPRPSSALCAEPFARRIQADQRPGAPDVSTGDHGGNIRHRHPLDDVGLNLPGRLGDPLRTSGQKQDVLCIDHARHGLIGDQVLDLPGPIAGLLLHLPGGRRHRILPGLHQPARQLPAPPVK